MDTTQITLIVIGVLFISWFLYITRSGRDVDSRNIYSRLQRGWRRLVFWAGDVWISKDFSYIHVGEKEYKVSYEEYLKAITLAKEGDVMLTTHAGFPFSNSAIPGIFKHALIVSKGPVESPVGNFHDITNMRIIEAISEGVVERHPMHVRADYMILLRPKNVTDDDILRAVTVARKIVGSDYDADFKFDIEEELQELNKRRERAISPYERDKDMMAEKELRIHATNLAAEFDHAFSCTETVATAWWHKRDMLNIYRKKTHGRSVIVSDQFINPSFEIIWISKSVTPKMVKNLDDERPRQLISDYWRSQKCEVTTK